MLHRIGLNRNLRLITRCLSDKSTENDGKTPEVTNQQKDEQKKSNTEKIQNLLKSMMSDPKISESEYRQKFATAPARQRKPKADEIEVKIEKIEDSLTKAAGEVASAIGGDIKQTEAELLSKVLGKINQTSTNLSDLLIGMKVDHSKDSETTRGERVRNIVSNKTKDQAQSTRYMQRKVSHTRNTMQKMMRQATVVDIYGPEPLGIFKAKGDNYGTTLEVWENLQQRELTLATSQPPANYFQKMILWTEQGKVWKFPIDNEQGLEEEQNTPFTEHIFVDALLEGWCPKRGPVRHFMELVCVGLSKNPFYTAQEKKDHIMWYKEYFESKKELLTEVGAWEKSKSNEASEST